MSYSYLVDNQSPYENFLYALKSTQSKRQYPSNLDHFFKFLGISGALDEKCKKLYDYIKSKESINAEVMQFVSFQKERIARKEIVEATLKNYIKALKLFCEMNELVSVSWKKISKGIPSEKRSADDRIPTMEELHDLLKHDDRRLKAIVLTMLSSGIRVGSWEYLKWKHVIPIKRGGMIVAAKLVITNTKINNRKYFSFITPEAYTALKEWMEFRQLHGELITGDSWLMRDIWERMGMALRNGMGMAQDPRKLSSRGIRTLLYNAWMIQGVRQKISDPFVKRHEFKNTHCFRKFFETQCQKVMNHNNIKLLMDHSMGESSNYYRPNENELLDDYLNAVNLLTINEENRLKTENEKMRQELDDTDRKFLRLESRFAEIAKMMGLE